MKQLLIVNSSTTVNDKAPAAYDTLAAGEIAFFQVLNGVSTQMSAGDIANGNFGIALGRPNGQVPFMIPEVDVKTLTYTKAAYDAGKAFKRKFTFPTPVVGTEYTILFVKKGTVPHERNTWHCSIVAGTATASTEAAAFKAVIEDRLGDKFTVSVATAAITITGKNVGEQWDAKLLDGLAGVSFAGSTDFVDAAPAVGDAAYVKELASKCAAGKGFTDTYEDGATTIPGYPEAVEPSGQYTIFTLRFAVPRVAAKTRDEVVNQVVHIACTSTQAEDIEDLITPADSSSSNSSSSGSGSGSGTGG